MLRSLVGRRWHANSWRRGFATGTKRDPLRILFCGSDEFSIASLKALYNYSQTHSNDILSIDVVTRPDKLTARGMKRLRSPPIKLAAEELGLRVHQIDTFTGWNPPDFYPRPTAYINLVIAVSFGLLIPRRILSSARFGGLNVHPSLLPELRGAAPLEWTIIRGLPHTGVSVQTLHPTKFDEGIVLAQTPEMHVPQDATPGELKHILAPVGGEMLVNVIKEGIYLNQSAVSRELRRPTYAPKVLPRTKALDWTNDDLETILRKNRAIPKLYAYALQRQTSISSPIRVVFGTDLRAEQTDIPSELRTKIKDQVDKGLPFAITKRSDSPSRHPSPLFMVCKDGDILTIPRLLVAGKSERPASQIAAGSRLFDVPFDIAGYDIHRFHRPLAMAEADP